MLYVQQFQNNRLDYLKEHQRLCLSNNQNFSLCSNQYIEKFPKLARLETPSTGYPRNQTLFFLSGKSSSEIVSYTLFFSYELFHHECCFSLFYMFTCFVKGKFD